LASAGLDDHVREGETRQVLSHVITHIGPHAKKDALALVVAGAVTVGLAEVTSDDRAIDGGDDLGERYRFGASGEHVAATHAALGTHETDPLEAEQDLFQIGLGESGALGEVAHRGGCRLVFSEGQTE